jgi:hypothetical protein
VNWSQQRLVCDRTINRCYEEDVDAIRRIQRAPVSNNEHNQFHAETEIFDSHISFS